MVFSSIKPEKRFSQRREKVSEGVGLEQRAGGRGGKTKALLSLLRVKGGEESAREVGTAAPCEANEERARSSERHVLHRRRLGCPPLAQTRSHTQLKQPQIAVVQESAGLNQ